jgi:hypothetical protein
MSLLDDVKDFPASKWGGLLSPANQKDVKGLSFRARQFIFDEAASAAVGTFIRTCPDIIIDQLEFAQLPYEVTYIEVDLQAMHAALGRPTSNSGIEADWKIGFLAYNGAIWSLSNARNHLDARVNPFGTIDIGIKKVHGGASVQEASILQMLGSTYNDLSPERRRKFADRFGIGFYGPPGQEKIMGRQLIDASTGEARTFAACLLMLYQKQNVVITDRPFERKMARGKSRVFMAHSTVTINLHNEGEFRKAFSITDRASPRAHEVRFTYAHRHGTRNCEHKWIVRHDEKTGEEKKQWDCQKCGRMRWFRKAHQRGDASKGWVTKDYKVTA